MRRPILCLTATLSLLLIFSAAQAERLTFTMNAGPYQIKRADDGFDRIDMADFDALGEPGKPLLPVRQYHFAIPPGAQVTSVRIVGEHEEILEGSHRIAPAPGVIPLDANGQSLAQSKLEWQASYDATYRSDNPYPSRVGDHLGTGGLRKYRILRVAYYPFAYRPVSGQLSFCPQAAVEVDYRLPDAGTPSDERIRLSLQDRAGDERARELLDNYEQARIWYAPGRGARTGKSTSDYVIITTSSLESAVADLVDWKEEIGHSVAVVTTSWITANYSGSDLPKKIHNFLVDKYIEWGIEYVLLAGNIDVIPMRSCYPDGHSNAVPTDYYYADLTGDWDFDGDGYYGEPGQDSIDFLAEVTVGRIPYSSSATIADICDKLVATESDTGSWKDNALLLGAFINFANEDYSGYAATDGAWAAELMSDDVFDGWGITTMYEKAGRTPSSFPCDFSLTSANVVSQWSANDYGVVAWAAHGSSDAAWRKYWSSDDGDNVPESGEMTWASFFSNSNVSSLDDDHPSIVFCASCENGHPEASHLARELIKNGSAGAVAATRVSYGIIGWNEKDEGGIESLSYYFNDYLVNKDQPVGDALYNSKYFCWTHNWQNYQNMYDFCLYGDPALRRVGMAPTPQVVAWTPQPNGYMSALSDNITAGFDRPMDAATLSDTTFLAFGELHGRYQGTVSYDPMSQTVTLDPTDDLLPGELLWIQVSSEVRSAAGTPVSGGHGWLFRPLTIGGSGTFGDSVTFGSGLDPAGICPGDFDGDGLADLAVVDGSSENVAVWTNDGLGLFTLDGTYGVGSGPKGLAAGDLDGDGHLDLITADSSDHQISVLLNDGDGTFSSAQAYATSQRPRALCVSDLNGDGHLDVAVACSQYDDISVLLNDGSGAFSAAVDYDVGAGPRSIVAGDLNGDGHVDLATANFDGDNISVLINDGDGTFMPQTNYSAGDGPSDMSVADLNGDGLLDLAVANKNANSVAVLLNGGSAIFALDSSYAVASQPTSICVSDLEGDEDGDLLLACAAAGHVAVLLNRGDGTFQEAPGASVGGTPVDLCAADLDSDGDPDLTTANAISENISVFFNIDALKVLATSPPRGHLDVPGTTDLVADFNSPLDQGTLDDSAFVVWGSQSGRHWGQVTAAGGDSSAQFSPDVPFAVGEMVTAVITSGLKSHIGIPLNKGYGWSFFAAAGGQGLFPDSSRFAADNTPHGIIAAELNGDGLVDLATADYLACTVGVFFNQGDGTFLLDSLYSVDDGPWQVCALDLEGDGDLDLASVNGWNFTVTILRNDGGVFSPQADYPVGTSPYDMCSADLDGDGDPDLAITNSGDDDVSVLFNLGDGSFAPQVRYATGNVPWGVAAGDVDGDGDFDLAVANWADNTFSVLANKGTGVFSGQQVYPVSGNPRCLALGELNDDGYLDVAMTSYEDNLVMVAFNLGDGSYGPDSAYSVKGSPSWLHLTDLDSDGEQDLAVARASRDSVLVMKNDGQGAFGQRQTYPVGDKPMGLCGVDADGNGAVDLAVTCYNEDLVTLLYNAAEDWPPAAVAGLCADLADDRLHLAWQAVTLDEGGNPIAVDHYIIYRQTVPDFVPVPGDSLAATADTFYDDTTAALKDPGVNHYYLVRAADAQGRKSAVSATVGEFDIMLRETPK